MRATLGVDSSQALVFRRIHKPHKANGRVTRRKAHLSLFLLFLLFFRQIIAVDISFSAEILGRRGFGERKNSGGVRCSFAVPRCSGWKNPKTKKGTTAGDRFIAPSDGLSIPATISQQRVIVNLTNALLARPGLPLRVATAAHPESSV
jgi:hypothetical protein